MRKLFWGLLIVGVGVFLARKTSLSYAGTLWSQVKTETKNHVPTRFEIQRVRHELAQLDNDIGGMIRPIAEYKQACRLHEEGHRQGGSHAGGAEAAAVDDGQGPRGQSDDRPV